MGSGGNGYRMVSCHPRIKRVAGGSGGCGSGVNVEGRAIVGEKYRWRKARRDMKDIY